MIKIYTDGSCIGNPGGAGGYCFLVVEQDAVTITPDTFFEAGGANNTTNNRMELTAILEALQWCDRGGKGNAMIYSDSKYCVKGINTWMHSWIKKDWKDVKNVDLFKPIYQLAQKVKVHLEWVRGHNGNAFNDFVDGQAEKMAVKFLENQFARYSAVDVGNKISMAVDNRKWHSHFKVIAKFESSGTLLLSPVNKGKVLILSAEEFDAGNHILI